PNTLTTMNNLARFFQDAGKLDKAVSLFEETLKLRKTKLGPDHPDTLTSMGDLGNAYSEAKQSEKAAPLLKDFTAGMRQQFPKDDPRLVRLLAGVSLSLIKCDQCIVAEEMLRECLTILEKKQPEVWTTFYTNSLLGGALLGQKKYADAEPLLLKGYEGMKTREKTIPPQGNSRIPEALDRLIELYTATNKPDEVKKYRELRAKYPTPKEHAAMPREMK
ncbi:MAG: tetratricopeptide repeat protein, partial [Gemmataceae bacterium]